MDAKKEEINELNVFPVPDGDTGTNMSMTMNAASLELSRLESPTLGRVLEVTSGAVLRGARGNSGVITSLLFRGICKSMKDLSSADALVFANAMTEGVSTAYNAVMKPAEGTILTVSRVSALSAMEAAQSGADLEKMLMVSVEAAKMALEATTDQNPVLKKAGVVDAGAYGYLIMLEAMYSLISGKSPLKGLFKMDKSKIQTPVSADFSQFEEEKITFTYCCEFMAQREDRRRSPKKLRSFLSSIGDCVVVVDDDKIVKIHVHTDNPDRALAEGLRFGTLSSIKIENMNEQYDRKLKESREQGLKKRTIAPPEKRYGFVAVAAGEGVCSVFTDLGVDSLVEGGQTMNPSTEDILEAIDRTPAEVVFVLPNNKNIIMASEQAAELSQRQVVVLGTCSIPQGIGAMLSFDPEQNIEDNTKSMQDGMNAVKTGQITYAARDAEFDGRSISQGDYMALSEGKLIGSAPSFDEIVKRLAREMCDRKSSFITIIYGEGADQAQAEQVKAEFEKEAKNAEIDIICGGQPVYSFIISVE